MISPEGEKNVVCIGNSLAVGGECVDEVYRRLTKTDAVCRKFNNDNV